MFVTEKMHPEVQNNKKYFTLQNKFVSCVVTSCPLEGDVGAAKLQSIRAANVPFTSWKLSEALDTNE